jgi:hypothetical protein
MMEYKQLRITTITFNSKGVSEDCIFEDRAVKWTVEEAKKQVMEMAMTYAPESKTNVYQSFSDNNLGYHSYKTYCYAVAVRKDNVKKEFEFHHYVEYGEEDS